MVDLGFLAALLSLPCWATHELAWLYMQLGLSLYFC